MNRALRWLFHAMLVRPFVWGVLGISLHHGEHLPRSGPAIVVANHNSHLDALVLMTLFPLRYLARLRPVAAKDYFFGRRWFTWLAVNIFGVIPMQRRGVLARKNDPLAPCSAALRRGDILILYPEGTRGEPERLQNFKSGIFHLAKRHPDVPVVPVFLHGPGKSLPKGTVVPVPFICHVLVGHAMAWTGDRKTFMDRLWSNMTDLAREGRFPAWE